MERFDHYGNNATKAELRVRALVEIGRKDPAALTLDDVRVICEAFVAGSDHQDDIVLQNRFPPFR